MKAALYRDGAVIDSAPAIVSNVPQRVSAWSEFGALYGSNDSAFKSKAADIIGLCLN